MIKRLLFSCLFFAASLKAINHTTPNVEAAYVKSPYVEQSTWEQVSPYLLPENHPIKTKLDALFSQGRITLNAKTLKKAGFKNTKPRKYSTLVVATHPDFKGYYFKVMLDDYNHMGVDWQVFLWRVLGARSLQEAIIRQGSQGLFKVPQKWLYPIPSDPSPPPGITRRNFLLVVEDADLISTTANTVKWNSDAITPSFLNALFCLLRDEGLADCVYAHNLPFARDGRLAFIDLEHHHTGPVKYEKLLRYLSKEAQKHWQALIDRGGP